MVDREEEVVSGPHRRPNQDDAVFVGTEDSTAGLQLRPPLAECTDADAAALGLDQPVHLFRLVPSPQVGQRSPWVLEGVAQGGDGTAEFEVVGLSEAQQGAARPLGHRHAQPVGSGVLRSALGAVLVHRVQGQALALCARYGMPGRDGVGAEVGVQRRDSGDEFPVRVPGLVLQVRGDVPADLGGSLDDLSPRGGRGVPSHRLPGTRPTRSTPHALPCATVSWACSQVRYGTGPVRRSCRRRRAAARRRCVRGSRHHLGTG